MIQILSQETLLNLRRIALKNIKDESMWRYIEKCYRHYSVTYHTPLHLAKQILTIPEVILISMEDEMKDMPPDDVEEWLLKYDGKIKPMIEPINPYLPEQEEVSDDLWIAQQEKELKQKEAKEAVSNEDIIKKTHEAMNQFKTHIAKFAENLESDS